MALSATERSTQCTGDADERHSLNMCKCRLFERPSPNENVIEDYWLDYGLKAYFLIWAFILSCAGSKGLFFKLTSILKIVHNFKQIL